MLQTLMNFDELLAILKFKFVGTKVIKPLKNKDIQTATKRRCYEFLNATSRSFAAVIQSLDDELRHPVCIFYLVLRALDTVEDDMTIPSQRKVAMLKEFYQHLREPEWNFTESKEKDRMVLEEFPVISAEFLELQPAYQSVIEDVCRKMGEGMTVYLDKAPGSLQEWDEYCHYVAGLVGIGLSRLFTVSGLETGDLGTEISNSMGLFLQKTNITRDYLEDVCQNRIFWPKQVWSQYCDSLDTLKDRAHTQKAVGCLNELVTNALQHVPHCIEYMQRIRNQSVFNFCAIPQVMAIATLERCYNNAAVFRGVVKIRKGEAVKLIMEATDMDKVKAIFTHYVNEIQKKIPADDPSLSQTRALTRSILRLTQTEAEYKNGSSLTYPVYLSLGVTLGAYFWPYVVNMAGYVCQAVGGRG